MSYTGSNSIELEDEPEPCDQILTSMKKGLFGILVRNSNAWAIQNAMTDLCGII